MKKDIENLSEWIENREMRGYYTFTKEDIEKQFPSLGKDYMKTYQVNSCQFRRRYVDISSLGFVFSYELRLNFFFREE